MKSENITLLLRNTHQGSYDGQSAEKDDIPIIPSKMSVEIGNELWINFLQLNIAEEVEKVAINPTDMSLNSRFFELFDIALFVNRIGKQIIYERLFFRGNRFALNDSELIF